MVKVHDALPLLALLAMVDSNAARTHHTPRWACASSSAVSPPSYTEMVPDEAEITTAVASVTVVIASAAA